MSIQQYWNVGVLPTAFLSVCLTLHMANAEVLYKGVVLDNSRAESFTRLPQSFPELEDTYYTLKRERVNPFELNYSEEGTHKPKITFLEQTVNTSIRTAWTIGKFTVKALLPVGILTTTRILEDAALSLLPWYLSGNALPLEHAKTNFIVRTSEKVSQFELGVQYMTTPLMYYLYKYPPQRNANDLQAEWNDSLNSRDTQWFVPLEEDDELPLGGEYSLIEFPRLETPQQLISYLQERELVESDTLTVGVGTPSHPTSKDKFLKYAKLAGRTLLLAAEPVAFQYIASYLRICENFFGLFHPYFAKYIFNKEATNAALATQSVTSYIPYSESIVRNIVGRMAVGEFYRYVPTYLNAAQHVIPTAYNTAKNIVSGVYDWWCGNSD